MVSAHENKDRVTWGLPWNVELLNVNDLIGMHDFLCKSERFCAVHVVDLLYALFVDFLESLIFCLEVNEALGELLVVRGDVHILELESVLLLEEFYSYNAHDVSKLAPFFFQIVVHLLVHILSFRQNLVVKVKFFFI